MANHNFNVLLHGSASDAADNLYYADCNTEPHELAAALTNALRCLLDCGDHQNPEVRDAAVGKPTPD